MFSIVSFDQLPSTNDYLKQYYQDYPNQTIILAKYQTHGRGRFDRIWESNQDLTFSILFSCGKTHGLIAPLAIVNALSTYGIKAMIKWPNDVLVHGKKVCGILVERVYEGNQPVVDIVGIGVNLSEKKELADKAGCIPLPKNELFTEILFQYEQLMSQDNSELLQKIKNVSYLDGKKILLDGIIWEVDGMEEHGYLCVHHEATIRILKSEEVTLDAIYEKEQL